MINKLLMPYFSGLGKRLSPGFVRNLEGVIRSASSSTYDIARAVGQQNGKDFNTNEKNLAHLLSNRSFQINDAYWRMHIKLVFDLLKEHHLIDKKRKIPIHIDFTTDKDDFLILCASVSVGTRSIPLYFSMRNYPKQANSYNHKKMELAFLKALRHLLSKHYQYILIADRGFGNSRFIGYCESLGLDYVIRIEPNMIVTHRNQAGLLKKVVTGEGVYRVSFKPWQITRRVSIRHYRRGSWYLVTNNNELAHTQLSQFYQTRFQIEGIFKDLKSSGFQLERSKIKKYDRFKRLVALCMTAHAILVMTGRFIQEKATPFLKSYPLHGGIMQAYLPLENWPFLHLKPGN